MTTRHLITHLECLSAKNMKPLTNTATSLLTAASFTLSFANSSLVKVKDAAVNKEVAVLVKQAKAKQVEFDARLDIIFLASLALTTICCSLFFLTCSW